jgi:hypothetical protein
MDYNGRMRTDARSTGRPSAGSAAGLAIGCALALTATATSPALADPTPEEILFQSSELKIYRTLSRGTPVLVLTNVDAEGNFLPGRDPSGGRSESPAVRPGPDTGRAETRPERDLPVTGEGATDDAGRVRVVVHGDGGAAAPDERDVEVTTDRTGDTTVIININPPPPPQREPVEAPVWSYPVVVTGLPGPIRYPEHQYFLGYGPNNSSPSMFSGLGLNSGNRFGLKTGVACDKGYDCMFGPTSSQP